MIEAGAVENIEAIFGLHVADSVPIGVLASRPGPIMAGSGFFEAVISGKGGHAALPHHTIDPILAASNVIMSLQQLVSRDSQVIMSRSLGLTGYHHRLNRLNLLLYAINFQARSMFLMILSVSIYMLYIATSRRSYMMCEVT